MFNFLRCTLLILASCLGDVVHAKSVAHLMVAYCGNEPNLTRSFKIGDTVTVCVYALDADNHLSTDYDGAMIKLRSSDPGVVLPTPHVFKPEDGAIFTFTIVFRTAGTPDPANPSITSHTIEVSDTGHGFTDSHTFFLTQN